MFKLNQQRAFLPCSLYTYSCRGGGPHARAPSERSDQQSISLVYCLSETQSNTYNTE